MHTNEKSPVYLRDLLEEDIIDAYLDWFRDDDVTRYLEIKSLTRPEALDFLRRGHETGDHHLYAIVLKQGDRHIGNIKIGVINRANGVYTLNTLIGDKTVWGKGIASDAIRIANAIAFDEYGARKLSAGMYGDNVSSIKAYTNAGWVIEGRQVGHYIVDGEVRDGLLVACFNEKYFDIKDGAYVPKRSRSDS